MKNLLNAEETLDLLEMKSAGYGSRYIAKLLGISKSSVNNYYKLWLKSQTPVEDSLQVEYEKAVNRGLYGTDYKPEDVALKKVINKLQESFDGETFGIENAYRADREYKKSPLDNRLIPEAVFQEAKKRLTPKKPRVLFIDLETSADIVACFGRFKQNLGEKNIVHQGNQIICAAWKFIEDSSVHTSRSSFSDFKIDMQSEKYLLERIYATFKETDVVVIHNAGFDLGTIQHRMLEHGMGVLPKVKVIDTLQIAKKYLKLRSNKLDSITKYFGLSNKIENSGIDFWIKVQQGDEQAMQTMLAYNVGDITALEAVYTTFVPLNQGTSLAPMMPLDSKHCTSCGSTHVHPTGRTISTSLSMFSEYECNECGAKMRDRVNVLSKEQRKNLLMPL